MTAPSPVVRAVVYERDLHRCVSCGREQGLQFQHRQATGMGGSKLRPLYVDGITSCAVCNEAYEHRLQPAALRFGWKVRGWVEYPGMVPVWYPLERSWFRLTLTGSRRAIPSMEALDSMHEVYGDEYLDETGLIG